jgi:hypothetical protein
MIYPDKENEIKRKVINIIKIFRSLGLLSDSDIRITGLEKSNNQYDISGEYKYKPMYRDDINEEGTFNISLNENTLDPVKVKITPGVNLPKKG